MARDTDPVLELSFSGETYEWRGPAPYHFVRVPQDESDAIAEVAALVTYGWGMIPVSVTVGRTSWETALWPQADGYVLPLKLDARRREDIQDGQLISVSLVVHR